MDAGAETQLEFNWAPTSGGAYILKVVADIDNEVSESNESNNESSVEVNGAYLETVILRHLMDQDSPHNGTYMELRVTGKRLMTKLLMVILPIYTRMRTMHVICLHYRTLDLKAYTV